MKCPVCKKDIPKTTLKCPYCKTRTGLLCSNCDTINPIGSFNCSKCGHELLKVCKHCNSINFPSADRCRKCGSMFSSSTTESQEHSDPLKFSPKYTPVSKAPKVLEEMLKAKNKRIYSISGAKGSGKTTLLNNVIKNTEKDGYQWCIGCCSSLSQITPGGVIHDMLLNLFNLPAFSIENNELKDNALKFFSNEFRFLNPEEVKFFFDFVYNSQDGNYEEIIINKKRTLSVLNKVFRAFANTGKFIFVVDNFDFIDGFSIEMLSNIVQQNIKHLKLILIYNDPRPVNSFFAAEELSTDVCFDLNLSPFTVSDYNVMLQNSDELWTNVTAREKDIIFKKSLGNPAYIEQALCYSFDCQISDRAFILPNSFNELINARLAVLEKINKEAYKLLCGAAVLGYKINYELLKEIFGYQDKQYEQIIQYLLKTRFIKGDKEYEFSSLVLWETLLKSVSKKSEFVDLNVKIGKALSVFTVNTHAIMAVIAHNIKQNRLAFDIWTKITRLASYIGDINLYVIAQRQCLALINEFNESETLNIRYNISERLGKLLSLYDPKEAMEFLPDAISHAKEKNDEAKEIELLGYLALCCEKTGNYYGKIECVDSVLRKISTNDIESALVRTSKLSPLISIGNCSEVVNVADNDILPKINSYLIKPLMNKVLPLGLVFDAKLNVMLALAKALSIQGDDRSFEVLTELFSILEKNKINDSLLLCKAKLVLAYANTMKGNYSTSEDLLGDIDRKYREEIMDNECISQWNLIYIVNKFLKKEYTGIRESLFDCVTFANNIGDNFAKNIFRVLLGKTLRDAQKSKKAIEIYDEQVSYFAKEKIATGALLCWYFIADATLVIENPKNAISIASQALEIAKNPKINNKFFIVLLNLVLAKCYMNLSDFETAKMYIETALSVAKKHNMNDLLSRCYILYGNCYREVGSVNSKNQMEFLKASKEMYEKSMDIIGKYTGNLSVKEDLEKNKAILYTYCEVNGITL